MDITSYLINTGVIVGKESFSKVSEDRPTNDIEKQLELIVHVQNLLMKQRETIIPRINSSIGKDIENFKVQIKKNIRLINSLKEEKDKSQLEIFIVEEGTRVINRARDTIKALDNDLYLTLIKRSMRNYEVCLGRVDEGNLKQDDNGVIKIRTVKYISYNLVESDCYNYIKRLKRREYQGDINNIIKLFVRLSSLPNESEKYIRILANYPIEQMRVLSRYREEKGYLLDKEWMEELSLAYKKDGNELL